jgi:hypothetical protein
MGSSVFPVPSSTAVTPVGWTAGVAGTFTLSSTLTVGTYLIQTDATQIMTITLVDSAGHRYAGTVRGGSGFVSVATAVNQIIIPGSLTYPFGIQINTISVTQLAAPTSLSLSVSSSGLCTGTWGTAPAGATGAVLFTPRGTVLNFSSTTSGATVGLSSADVNFSASNEFVVAFKNSSGAIGIGAAYSVTIPASFDTIADVLIVAGGGSGGYTLTNGTYSGGGGAGGYRTLTSTTLPATFTVTVGAGGPGGFGATGANGSVSTYNTTPASGGGKGFSNFPAPGSGVGSSGGSGGAGNSAPNVGAGNAGGYTPVEGYAGSTTGGGGSAGTGGAGTANSITGTSVTYAAGGLNNAGSVLSGSANTGNGGSGTNVNASPAQQTIAGGGSGVVIIAYPDTAAPLTTIPGTLTYDQPTRSGYRVYRFTAGTGTVTK